MNKPKLYIMQGLPASGKSTKAKEIVERGNTVRVNKDLIRTMLHFDKFDGKNEKYTSLVEEYVADCALDNDLNVVVDDTNLNPKVMDKWIKLAIDRGINHEVVVMDTPIGECLSRDATRSLSVGRDVIIKMALQHCEFLKGEKFIICDLDGTLCNVEHRLKYARGPEKDWGKFFDGIPGDSIRVEVVKQLVEASHEHGARIIYVSARQEKYRKLTEEWFDKNGVQGHYLLIMRPNNDSRYDTVIKREIYDKYLKHLDIVKVFDDRLKVIRMWREVGLDVVDVGTGEEF